MKYSEELRQTYALHANPVNADPMKKYMRDQYDFYGIKTPERRAILKDFVKEHGLPKKEQFHEVILDLWDMPERELQIVAIGLIDYKQKKKELTDEFVPLLEKMITHKSWWDTVDHIASNHVGYLFNHYPECIHTVGLTWRNCNNIWLRRTMILFQLKYKTSTDMELLAEIIVENLGSKEFFINKAIGWVLREYAKTNPTWVKKFVEEHPLSSLSKREALKHFK